MRSVFCVMCSCLYRKRMLGKDDYVFVVCTFSLSLKKPNCVRGCWGTTTILFFLHCSDTSGTISKDVKASGRIVSLQI
jgi:Fe-S-cluster-containing dehydrogenase component